MDLARNWRMARSQVSALSGTWLSVAGSSTIPPVFRAALWHPTQYWRTTAAGAALGAGVCVRPLELNRNAPRIVPAANHLALDFPVIKTLIIIQRRHAGSEPAGSFSSELACKNSRRPGVYLSTGRFVK